MIRRYALGLIAALLLATPWGASSEEPELPAAEVILGRHMQAVGGEEALAGIESSVSKGTLEMVGMGISGALTVLMARPAESSLRFEAGALGTIRSGTNDGVAWELSDLQGPRLLEGAEKELAIRSAMIDSELHWRDHYASATTTGVAEVDGRACYVLEMKPNEGKAETWYIDRKSSLLVKMEMTMVHPMGEIPLEMSFDDYREVDGVKIAFRTSNKLLAQEMLTVLDSVEHNVEIPADAFALPEEIEALLAQQQQPE